MDSKNDENELRLIEFVLRGKVYAGNYSQAIDAIYWALNSGEYDGNFVVDNIRVEKEKWVRKI